MKNSAFSLVMVSVIGSILGAQKAHAWGQYGHEQVNDAAITILGTANELGKCFDANRYVLKRAAITPDVEWKADMSLQTLSPEDKAKRFDDDKYEHSMHFDEVDAWVPNPRPGDIAKLPAGEYSDVYSSYQDRLQKNAAYITEIDPSKKLKDPNHPTVNEVTEHGTAPWRALQLYRLGVEALKAKDVQLAMFYLGTMGHYVGDMSQPFHASLNFDGQHYATPAAGIHHEIDTGVLPQKGKDENDVYPSFEVTEKVVLQAAKKALGGKLESVPEDQIVAEIFKMIDGGHSEVEAYLKPYAEECAATQSESVGAAKSGGAYCVTTPGNGGRSKTRPLPAAHERNFGSKVVPSIEGRLGEAAALLARMWLAAYVAAGKPTLSGCAGVKFDQSYAIQNYPRPSHDGPHGYLPLDFRPGRH